MKKFFVILFATCLFSSPALASKDDKVKELIEIMNLNEMERAFEQQIIDPIFCTFYIPTYEQKEIKHKINRTFNMKETTINISTPFWKENFTEEELDKILDFYKSDVGQKTISLMPQMTQYIAQKMVEYQQELTPKIKKLAEELASRYTQHSEEEIRRCMEQQQYNQ